MKFSVMSPQSGGWPWIISRVHAIGSNWHKSMKYNTNRIDQLATRATPT